MNLILTHNFFEGRRVRGAILFCVLERQGKIYTEIVTHCQTKNCHNEKLWKPYSNTDDGIQAHGNRTEKMVPVKRV